MVFHRHSGFGMFNASFPCKARAMFLRRELLQACGEAKKGKGEGEAQGRPCTTVSLETTALAGVRPPRATGPRVPHVPLKPETTTLSLDLDGRVSLPLTSFPSGDNGQSTSGAPLATATATSDVSSCSPTITPGPRGPSSPHERFSRDGFEFSNHHSAYVTPRGGHPISLVRPQTPISFGGRHSRLSTLTYQSSPRRHSIAQTHIHVQDGETLVGCGPGGRYSYASSTLRSILNSAEGLEDNPYKMSTFYEAYIDQDAEEDDWLHEVKLLDGPSSWRRSKRTNPRYDFEKRFWRTCCCCCCSWRNFGMCPMVHYQ